MKGRETCPTCDSGHLVQLITLDRFIVCMDCCTVFEPFPDTLEPGQSVMPEKCHDCAFRPGSPEQADKEMWAKVIQGTHDLSLMFFCHAGVHFDFKTQSYQYPKLPDGSLDVSRLMICRGWGNAWDRNAEKFNARLEEGTSP